jgi:hypothetical protein
MTERQKPINYTQSTYNEEYEEYDTEDEDEQTNKEVLETVNKINLNDINTKNVIKIPKIPKKEKIKNKRYPFFNKILRDHFEKKLLLLIESSIAAGEESKKTNRILHQVHGLLKNQNYINNQILKKNVSLKKKDIELKDLEIPKNIIQNTGFGGIKFDVEKTQINKGIKIYCFIQIIFILVIFFLSIGIILANGLTWMKIKVEFCIYLCLMIFGVFLIFGGLIFLSFLFVKKCFVKVKKNYSSLI